MREKRHVLVGVLLTGLLAGCSTTAQTTAQTTAGPPVPSGPCALPADAPGATAGSRSGHGVPGAPEIASGYRSDRAAALVDGLRARGHQVPTAPQSSGLSMLARTPDGWAGGADPRREGVVLGDTD